MGFTRKQAWRGLASAAFAAAVLALTVTAPADAQSSAATASARGGTAAAGTVSCTFSISTDSVSGVRNNFSIPVTCTRGLADSITVNVSYLDLDQKPVRTENARTCVATARATATASSWNDNEKWIYVCMQAIKGGKAHESCGTKAIASEPHRANQLVNGNSGLCVGIVGGNGQINASVVQFQCRSHEDQGWYMPWLPGSSVPNLKGELGLIKNFRARNRCLGTAAGATADSTKIVSRVCNAQNRDEMWLPVSAAAWGYPGFYVLENAKAGLGSCLGVPASSRAGSVQLVLYPCNGHLDQMWGRGPEHTGS
ncbi:RICIN domain-containing protein [Streptomyces sp. NPDC101152]|uniref:RICIN domain-containing protein n=1 Tax=Streptomyces sp. NPDC101152 TaxID=3366116 RepID=UPI0038290811